MMLVAPEIILTREYLMMVRQALLMQLDAIERLLNVSPRTAELRKEAKGMIQSELKEEKPC